MHGAAFGVVTAIYQARDSRLNHGAGTHGARLDGNVNEGAIQAVISDGPGGGTQSDDLRMGAWIASGNGAVPGASQEPVAEQDGAADGHFAAFRGGSRFGECHLHAGEIVHIKSLGSRNSREKIFDHGDIAKAIGVAGMLFVSADDAPSGNFAQTQTLFVIGKDPADELAVSAPGGFGLSHAHQLAADTIAAKGAPHKDAHFADLAEMQFLLVGLDADHAANQITDFGDKYGMPRIPLRPGDQALLVLDGTQGAVEGGEAVFHGVVEDFAKSRRVLFTRWPDIQMSTLRGRSHGEILTSGVSKSRLGWRFSSGHRHRLLIDGIGRSLRSIT
jgi:hypothetical protein